MVVNQTATPPPPPPPRINNARGNFRRLFLTFYTLLTIFLFVYWEGIQTWYNNSSSSSSLIGAYSRQIQKSPPPNNDSTDNDDDDDDDDDDDATSSSHNSVLLLTNADKILLLSFCGACNYYHLGDDSNTTTTTTTTTCNDRVDWIIHNLHDSTPTKELAQLYLMKVGHCITELDDDAEEQQRHQQGVQMITAGETAKTLIESTSSIGAKNNTIGSDDDDDDDAGGGGLLVKVDYIKDSDRIILPTWDDMRNDEDGTFTGASKWYRYWTMVSSTGSSQLNTNIDHSYDDHVLSRVKEDSMEAFEHTMKMKARYDEVNAIPDYRARGLGWIEHRLGMILTVIVAGDDDAAAAAEESSGAGEKKTSNNNNHTLLSARNVSIFIVDVVGDMKCGRGDNNNSGEILPANWMDYHPPLTMWVRANGPEIFAGTALPHVFASSSSSPDDRHRCAWRYDFQAKTPGVYSIYVKVLTFNGFADWDKDLCQTKTISWEKTPTATTENVSYPQLQAAIVHELADKGNFSHHRGLMAFKNYDKIHSCCEACTRARGCRMWSIPGEIDECELFFDKIEDDIDFWDGDRGKYLGRDRKYSYQAQSVSDFPVVRRSLGWNDHRKLAMSRNQINLAKWPGLDVDDSYGYPRTQPALDFIGCGWSCLKSFESPCHYPSDDLIFGSGKRIEINAGSTDKVEVASIASKVEVGRACTVEDESFGNGRWVKYPFPDDSVCMPVERDLDNDGFRNYMPKYNGTSMPPYCWHRDSIDQCCKVCGEMGCKFIINHRWVSDLRRDGKWFGRWENHNCYYKDMGSEEIQQCIDRKNISNIEVKGASVKAMISRYIEQKLKGIKMAESTPSSRKIFLDTLKMPHVVWHKSAKQFGKELDAYQTINNRKSEYYFVTGFYYSSEREPRVTVDRSLQFSHLAWEKLTPKGYKMINAFDVTAAFTFDSDAQNDGLHITGPPIRAILTKFFHHLCQE